MKVGFVIPVCDEQPTLALLTEKILSVIEQQQHTAEILLIDDGSKDDSWKTIEQLARQHPSVVGLRFRRNFGKAAALSAGFARSTADVVFTMDADLQDDPEEIPRFLEELDRGFDVVSGWKEVRHDPWHKRWPSRVFNGLVSSLTRVKLHDHNCGFKAYRREVIAEVNLYGERHRFVPVLAAENGWKVGELSVRHHPRRHGRSKYGLTRLVKGLLDLGTIYFLTGYARRPLHLLGTIGLICFVGGLGILGVLTFFWVFTRLWPGYEPLDLHRRALFYYSITGILLGSQLLVTGLLAEMLTAIHSRSNPPYSIAETTENE
jgi:dolichol-phosphate mannosyltransferase